MTFELKIRPPANNTLGQLSVKYKKTPLSLFTELSRAFPEIDWSTRDLFHIFNNHRLPFGHLIITDRIYNTKTHFFKSVEPEFLCDQKLANELARFAAQYCNYIVNPCTPPKTLEWEGITFCIEYSLWENLGEIPLDPNYFMNIGKDLAFFHRILRDFPKRKLIRRNSEIYFKKMNSTWSDLLNYRQSELPGPDPKQLQKVLRLPTIDFRHLLKNAQPLHGDLNNGNALWSLATNKIRILDFEETIRTHLSPVFDLALFIERNILVRISDNPSLAIACGRDFLKGYQMAGGLVDREEDLHRVLIWINQRALCLNAMCEMFEYPMPRTEWNKFFTRIRQLSEEKPILSAIWAG